MALTLDAIFKPLNDFFIQLYAAPPDSGIAFRFDKFGSLISDADFIDPLNPQLGYSQNRANERFSDLVNHIPVDAGDGTNIVFRSDAVDDAYFTRLLSPSEPTVNDDDPNAEDVIEAFSKIKSDALSRWSNAVLESSTGMMLEFRPSLAQPGNWYDRNAPDIWTAQTFSISSSQQQESNTPPSNPGDGRKPGPLRRIWRLRATDQDIQRIVPTTRLQLSPALLAKLASSGTTAVPANATTANLQATMPLSPALLAAQPSLAEAKPASAQLLQNANLNTDASGFAQSLSLRNQYHPGLWNESFADRLNIAQLVDQVAPTATASTDDISISFSYALVRITRPWLMDSFLETPTWYVPATAKGAVYTSSGALETTAFVVIKDLLIKANWTPSDISAAANASDFGPFKVEQGIVNHNLSHAGIQVIGWIVESLPALPPNDPPAEGA